ncbi:glycoside hydrolase superfamily [Aspergillus avenaceus]|uniref:Glycoside hydrolase superfamily n=1 Tax=Aspergillus avenaceus TaxID=36643 RepID=A0A5N6TRJ0_ASPAV|nr:glycoside hydrolase superfamily [Aspergillus avenaceus]
MASDSLPDSPRPRRTAKKWWKESTVYQVYPASFKDSNGDGIGDIPGITSKLDYIKNLGADIIWLNPIFCSPQIDMGYDVSDYYNIYRPFGTVDDLDRLTAGIHERGMKLVLDLVVNHTSDQHRWFQEARSSRFNPYRDWYVWKKPTFDADGNRRPPNNWKSYFGGSVWEYDDLTGEYYLHLFAKEQPDLNWENPYVRAAVHDIVRYWLNKGADGFRMDAINLISKDQSFPDAPVTDPNSRWQDGTKYFACGPRLHEYLQGIGKILKQYDAFSVGEMPEIYDLNEILRSVGDDRSELSMVFHFEIVSLDHGAGGKFTSRTWTLNELKTVVSKWQTYMHNNNGWNALYLENHDQPRIVSRFGSDTQEHLALSAKMLATFLGFQSGTLFIYQGQELGLPNVPKTWSLDQYRDIETLNHWHENQKSPHPESYLQEYRLKSRDNARTPMPWDSSPNAGFSTAHPWIPVNDNHISLNAATQITQKESVYNFWASILHLRKKYPDVLVYGTFELLDPDHEHVFAYIRRASSAHAIVVMNFKSNEVKWSVPACFQRNGHGRILLANYTRSLPLDSTITLRPFESFIWFSDSEHSEARL